MKLDYILNGPEFEPIRRYPESILGEHFPLDPKILAVCEAFREKWYPVYLEAALKKSYPNFKMRSVYLIVCSDPYHLYVGQTQRMNSRNSEHFGDSKLYKPAQFVKRHGYKQLWRIFYFRMSEELACNLEKHLTRMLMKNLPDYTVAGYKFNLGA